MRGAIFDVDGTLLDSMSVWYVITGKILKKRDIDANDEIMNKVKDITLPEACKFIKEYYGLSESPEEIMDEAKRTAAEEYLNNIPLKSGAAEYLAKLHEEGVKLAVATSGFPELAEAALKRCGVWELFSAKAYSFETGKDKSNPDIYLLAAERLGVEPAECTVYEDILPGICGAKKAGMKTVGVYDASAQSDARRIMHEADKYIMSWEELMMQP
ncbi:MAG: HAD family phosphatase [Oscillospiraceae bacterium]|nr:HAD family phosphatase [Oscillospiraceae bacterium]